MPSRFCIHYVSQSGRPSCSHRTGKGQSLSQFPRRLVAKNVLTIGQLHSSPMLVRSCLKSCMLGFSIRWTKNFQKSKLGLEKEEELEQIANIGWIIEKAREFQKNIYLCSIDYSKAFEWDHFPHKLWKALREMGIPDHLTYLLRNLYTGLEATVRTLYGTTDWFKIEKGIQRGCLLSPCLFNLYTEDIVRNARLDKFQAGIKIGGRNINNHRYADDTTLMAESEEELKRLLMRVRGRVKE